MATEVKAAGVDSAYRSGHEMTSDRTGITDGPNRGPNARRDLGDKASDMANNVAHKPEEAGDTLMDKATEIGHAMQDTGQNIAEKSKHAHQAICAFTRKNPTVAVLLAFGFGAVLARILPTR